MKKKNLIMLVIIILVFLIGVTIFVMKHKANNNIEEKWILKISPNYLDYIPNAVYIYEDSYIITNCTKTIHKRGNLTDTIDTNNLISKIKQEANQELEMGKFFSVTLQNGEKFNLTDNSEILNEIINMINYDGTIWYVQD